MAAASYTRFPVRRRITLAYGLLACLLFGLMGRVFFITVLKHDHYSAISERRAQRELVKPHERGRIVASDGQVLARTSFSGQAVFVNARQIPDNERREIAVRLATALELDAEELFTKLEKNQRNAGLPLKHFVSEEQARRVKVLMDQGLAPGVHTRARIERIYPKGQLASHVVGFTNLDGVGSGGVEMFYDKYLRGQDGHEVERVDARREGIHDLSYEKTPPVDGSDVYLTIDTTIQTFTETALADLQETWNPEYATAIVMESRTGRILAMANTPCFDPNAYFSASADDRNNHALTSGFEPGSIFKPLILAAAIEAGILTPQSTVPYRHSLRVPGRKNPISDGDHPIRAKDHVNADGIENESGNHVTAETGIIKSSNTTAFWVAASLYAGKRLPTISLTPDDVIPFEGNGRLDAQLRAFGFGERTGIDIGGGRAESTGRLPSSQEWQAVGKGNKLRYAIGQLLPSLSTGYQVLVSPLQMLNAFNAIAIDGVRMRPYVVERVVSPTGEVLFEQKPEVAGSSGFSPTTARAMREMLKGVVSRDGTARKAVMKDYVMAGKTGTANLLENGVYSNDKHQASFIGFAPADDPKLTILITVRNPRNDVLNDKGKPVKKYGGEVAAPYVRDIMEQSLYHLGVPSCHSQPKVSR